MTGNEQCVNISTKGLRDKRAAIYFNGGSHQAEQWVCVYAHQGDVMSSKSQWQPTGQLLKEGLNAEKFCCFRDTNSKHVL